MVQSSSIQLLDQLIMIIKWLIKKNQLKEAEMNLEVDVRIKTICELIIFILTITFYLYYVSDFIDGLIMNSVGKILLDFVIVMIGLIISGKLSNIVCRYLNPNKQYKKK